MRERVVWFNGTLIPESEAKISIYDSALMFGDMVFEMTRSFNKKQFRLREHLDRLYASMRYLHIDCGMDIGEMLEHCYETIEANDPLFEADDEHRLMIDVTRGALSIYREVVGLNDKPNVIISDFPLRWTVAGMGKLYDEGINAVITSQRAIPASLLEPKVKNRSRIHYQMANIEASKMKGKNNWALLLDPDGFIAEGTGDNFFIVKDRVVYTPEGRNILRGISRDFVMNNLCPLLELPCVEKNLEVYDVMTADEAFMTGTPFCILPVMRINGTSIGDGKMGEYTKCLLDSWSRLVEVDIVAQIKKWERKDGGGVSPYEFKSSKEAGAHENI